MCCTPLHDGILCVFVEKRALLMAIIKLGYHQLAAHFDSIGFHTFNLLVYSLLIALTWFKKRHYWVDFCFVCSELMSSCEYFRFCLVSSDLDQDFNLGSLECYVTLRGEGMGQSFVTLYIKCFQFSHKFLYG